MSDQNNDDLNLEDDVYDDVLDESFEEDFGDEEYLDDLEDLDLESDDLGGFDDDIPDGDFDDEWDDEDDDGLTGAGAGAQKKKSNFEMSFNAMAITGAVIVGLGVFGYQVVSKKPVVSIDTFKSALNMKGATDGVVFGDGEEGQTLDQTQDTVDTTSDNNNKTGFLYDPDILDSMEMELEDTPPMPSTISSETKEEIEPIPNIEDTIELPEFSNPVEDAVLEQVPRPPADVTDIDDALSDLIEPQEPAVSIKAEEFLKEKIKDREEQKAEVIKPIEEPVEIVATPEVVKPEPVQETKKEIAPVKVEQTSVAPNTTMPANTDVIKKLDMIVNRLDEMQGQINQIKQNGSSQIDNMSETISSLKAELGNIKSAPKAAAPVKAKTVKKAPVKKAAPKKKATKPRVSWDLRAAQPGKAWVSRKGQNNMQPVVVGDTLTGVGRITSISYSGGRWVVQGTSGRIRQ